MNKWISLLPVIVFLPHVSYAAINMTDTISISGFGSFSATKLDNAIPILQNREIRDDWCFDCDSTAGLQIDWAITNRFRTSVQVVKRPQDSFSSPEFEWAYLAYEYENMTFRAGRLRLPLFVMSEYYSVSYAYPWFRPPQDIYDSLLGITSYNGVSATWEGWIQDTVGISMTAYWSMQDNDTYYSHGSNIELDLDYSTGINLQLSYDDTLINFSTLFAKYQMNITHIDSGQLLSRFDKKMKFFTIGIEQYFNNLYVSINYPINALTPYLSYGQQRLKYSGEQILVGIRYDINRHMAFNLETQFFKAKENKTGYFTENVTSDDSDANMITAGISFVF